MSLALWGCLAAGCASGRGVQVYQGAQRPLHEVAQIGGTYEFFGVGRKAVYLIGLDGTPVEAGDVEVLPGEHSVSVKYERLIITSSDESVSPCYVTFRAEAGHAYLVDGHILSDYTWECWIEDTATKARTKGTFDPPPGWDARRTTITQ